MSYYVYIIKCKDENYYTGLTHNLKKRIKEHELGVKSGVKNKRPIQLVFYCCFASKHLAAEFEQYLKSNSGRAFRNRHLLNK